MADGRSLQVIAKEICEDWKRQDGSSGVNPVAKPYLEAMRTLRSVDEDYYHDSGRSIVNYFLANAQTWRGETARRIKAELGRLVAD